MIGRNTIFISISNTIVREGVKKNWEKAVRLTTWVEPPPPKRSGKCEKFWIWVLTLVYDHIWLITNFTPKDIFRFLVNNILIPHQCPEYKCNQCGRTFNQRGNLIIHIWEYTTLKSFSNVTSVNMKDFWQLFRWHLKLDKNKVLNNYPVYYFSQPRITWKTTKQIVRP